MVKPKVFISYAKEDRAYVYELSNHLKWLVRSGVIDTWNDLAVLPSSVYESEIIAQLETADIIIFLVSADFINSGYIKDVEIRKVIERHHKGEAVIIPIIVRPCDISILSISKFQALPENGQPISTWEDKDEAWMNIVNEMKKIIHKFDNGKRSRHMNFAKREESIDLPKNLVDKLKSENDKNNVENNIEKTIKELLTITKEKNNDLYNYVIMLLVRFKSYKQNREEGSISKEQAQLTRNQIKNTLLSIISPSTEYVN